jgi:tRNA 2-thiouridine synthesizing protein A
VAEHPDWDHQSHFDGGARECGELLLDLRRHFQPLPAGSHVLVTAASPAAPLELPTWCRLTGHRLLAAAHPHYLIEKH